MKRNKVVTWIHQRFIKQAGGTLNGSLMLEIKIQNRYSATYLINLTLTMKGWCPVPRTEFSLDLYVMPHWYFSSFTRGTSKSFGKDFFPSKIEKFRMFLFKFLSSHQPCFKIVLYCIVLYCIVYFILSSDEHMNKAMLYISCLERPWRSLAMSAFSDVLALAQLVCGTLNLNLKFYYNKVTNYN